MRSASPISTSRSRVSPGDADLAITMRQNRRGRRTRIRGAVSCRSACLPQSREKNGFVHQNRTASPEYLLYTNNLMDRRKFLLREVKQPPEGDSREQQGEVSEPAAPRRCCNLWQAPTLSRSCRTPYMPILAARWRGAAALFAADERLFVPACAGITGRRALSREAWGNCRAIALSGARRLPHPAAG